MQGVLGGCDGDLLATDARGEVAGSGEEDRLDRLHGQRGPASGSGFALPRPAAGRNWLLLDCIFNHRCESVL